MGVLVEKDVRRGFHCTPLQYVVFMGRSQSMMCKPSLRAAGFQKGHVRSTSSAQDEARGFGAYVHLTLERNSGILRAKLAAGFPHDGQIPIARDASDQRSMLDAHLNNSVIEVLIDGELALPASTEIHTFSSEDTKLAAGTLSTIRVPWQVVEVQPAGDYLRRHDYAKSVEDFVVRALADPQCRGDGLEFDLSSVTIRRETHGKLGRTSDNQQQAHEF